jgi:predicted alpha/beta-fold hydrolase
MITRTNNRPSTHVRARDPIQSRQSGRGPNHVTTNSAAVHATHTALTASDTRLSALINALPVRDGERNASRYSSGGRPDPTAFAENWNRSYTLPAATPRAAVLMLHGLSDSPYSLRALALQLNQQGCWVEGLRLPGHGTAPSGLTTVTWEDWAAAVRLAVRDLRQRVGPDVPVYITGYSTGAALAVA